VAHDLKNPLSLIIGFADLLQDTHDTLDDEALAGYARNIARHSRKMDNIISELLLLAAARQADVEMRTLDMSRIVREAQQRLVDMIDKAGAEIVAPTDWPVALGHGPWVEAVWVNYISNALKYGGDPPCVELGAEELDSDPPMLRFWVRDNGPGLTQAEQERLFAPFTRLAQVRAKGHGLGLSIVRRIVERLGGEVGVESSAVPGEGSVFSFTLPRADA
jgi:signal transduction histidine kinase